MIRADINEIETNKTTARINEAKSWFPEKKDKTDKPLARFTKKKKKKGTGLKLIKFEMHFSREIQRL